MLARSRVSATAITAMFIIAGASAANADTIAASVNLGDSGYSGAYWGSSEVGWLYTPSSSYSLSGIETKFSIPNQTTIEDRTVTVVVYQGGTPANGGTFLESFAFNSALADNNTLGGGTFATPISLSAGTTYFVGFENVGPAADSTGPNSNDLGVNFTADSGATFLSNLYYDSPGSSTCNTGAGFACEDTNMDILGQPILAFLTPSPVSTTPLPAALPLFAGGLGAMGLFGWRRKKKTAILPA
jgi:hypothetical protein